MLQLRTVSFIIFIYLLLFQRFVVECRPRIQRVLINSHEWTVPNEPGWVDAVQKADLIRHQLLSNCATIYACRLAAEQLRQLFLEHPVSANFYGDSTENDDAEGGEPSIFKWG